DAYWRVGRKLEATFQWAHARDLKPDPDVLATVLEKLGKGLPDITPKAVASLATPEPTPGAATDAPAASDEIAAPPAKPAEEPAQAVAGAAPTASQAYKVGPGQSLWSIATELLGSGSRYQEILD